MLGALPPVGGWKCDGGLLQVLAGFPDNVLVPVVLLWVVQLARLRKPKIGVKSDQTDLIALKEYSIQFFCLQFDA